MKYLFKYKNNTKENITFILEPWALEYLLKPEQDIFLICKCQEEEPKWELWHEPKYIVFHTWDHSLVEVYISGVNQNAISNSIMF